MEFTQEQVNEMIAKAVASATKGLYTEEDLNKKVTSEVDRRVESGIQKGIETQKNKWEEEFTKKATMTAEELAKAQLEEKMKEIQSKESEMNRRNNYIEAKDIFANASVSKDHYEKFLDTLVSDDIETTKNNVNNFINLFGETKKTLESQLKEQLTRVPSPPSGTGDKVITKEDFNKMTYADKVKLKTENPEMFNSFMNK